MLTIGGRLDLFDVVGWKETVTAGRRVKALPPAAIERLGDREPLRGGKRQRAVVFAGKRVQSLDLKRRRCRLQVRQNAAAAPPPSPQAAAASKPV